MKTYETKKQLFARLSGSRLTGRTAIVVFIMLLICAGCDTWRLEESVSNENLKTGLDKIDTVRLAEHSISPPVTVEEATEQITQQVTEPNQPRRTVTLSIEQVRAAALANNLDLEIELVSPSIAQRILDEEQAKFESTIFGSTNYQRTEAMGTGTVSETQTSELGICLLYPIVSARGRYTYQYTVDSHRAPSMEYHQCPDQAGRNLSAGKCGHYLLAFVCRS